MYSIKGIAQNFKGGFIAGFITSQISGDQLAGFNKLGGKIGTYINYPLNINSNLQLELLLSQKGSKKPYIENSLQTYSFELNYMEIPISFDYRLQEFFYIETGLSMGYLLNFKEENEFGEMITTQPNDLAIDFLVGANYQWKKNTKINLRYGHSIIPVRPHSSGIERHLNKGQNSSVISLSLYYQISGL